MEGGRSRVKEERDMRQIFLTIFNKIAIQGTPQMAVD